MTLSILPLTRTRLPMQTQQSLLYNGLELRAIQGEVWRVLKRPEIWLLKNTSTVSREN